MVNFVVVTVVVVVVVVAMSLFLFFFGTYSQLRDIPSLPEIHRLLVGMRRRSDRSSVAAQSFRRRYLVFGLDRRREQLLAMMPFVKGGG